MRKFLQASMIVFLVMALAFVGLPGTVQAQDDEVEEISFAGSTPGGLMYYLVGTAGTVFSRELDDYNITQVSTGGSTENTKRLLAESVDMGISYNPHLYLAVNKMDPFADDPGGDNLRAVTKIYDGMTKFVVRADSDIETMEDLKGKTVALGPPGSGTVWNSTNILEALDLMDEIDVRMMSFADAGRAVANRQIDAFAQSSAPAASVVELAETVGAHVIPFTDEEMDKIIEAHPFYYPAVMGEDVYEGVPATQLPHIDVSWAAHENVSEDAIYQLLKLAYDPEIKEELVDGNRTWGEMEPGIEGFKTLGIKIHPGAEKFFKEAGLWEE